MKIYHFGLAVTLSLGASQSAMALNITFDYSLDNSGFFDTEQKKQVLEAAGNFWGSRITSHLNAAVSIPGGSSYDARFGNPSDIIEDNGDLIARYTTKNNFSVQENEYKIFVGSDTLPGSTVALSSFGGVDAENLTVNGDSNYEQNVRTRGKDGFVSWGGWLAFDNEPSTTWYFDDDLTTTDVPDGQSDFYSFALHELGHILGIGQSEQWENNIFDFPGGKIYRGDNVLAINNGLPVDLTDDGTHFADGTNGLGGGLDGQIDALMDPTIEDGTRKLPTNLDYAVLKDIGWEVSASPVPVPTAVWLFGTAILGLFGTRRRQVA